jgi:ParB family chromosome partitioning protein
VNAMNTNRDKPSRLGRGLGALLPAATAPAAPAAAPSAPPAAGSNAAVVRELPISDVQPDRAQPRKHFDDAKLNELAASIRVSGVLQPILVRRDGPIFRIIAGERRWRASRLAGLTKVPVLVKDGTAKQAFEWALIENLQRQDLNPIEEAEGYERLIEEHKLTQDALAARVGKDRSAIANALRLLKLPEEVKGQLVDGVLAAGAARALLGLPTAKLVALAELAVEKGWSVREVEAHARGEKGTAGKKKEPAAAPKPTSAGIRQLEEELQRLLGTKVRIQDKGGGKGALEIAFFSHDEFDGLMARFRKLQR